MTNLYKTARKNKINVYFGKMTACGSCAVEGNVCLQYGLPAVEEREHLAHELGHCVTGAFYCRNASDIQRRRAERRAEKWTIKKLVPLNELKRARGTPEEIAELFGVSVEFLAGAVRFYRERGLW